MLNANVASNHFSENCFSNSTGIPAANPAGITNNNISLVAPPKTEKGYSAKDSIASLAILDAVSNLAMKKVIDDVNIIHARNIVVDIANNSRNNGICFGVMLKNAAVNPNKISPNPPYLAFTNKCNNTFFGRLR